MIVVLTASLAVLVGLVVALVLLRGGLSIHMAPATSSMSGGLPAGDVSSADLDEVRFDTVLRGYRMNQVDDVLARVRVELALRDDELRQLRSRSPAGPLRIAGGARGSLTSTATPAALVPPTPIDDEGAQGGDLEDTGQRWDPHRWQRPPQPSEWDEPGEHGDRRGETWGGGSETDR
ncbi:MAG: DivIVA domain-containing protein [Micrococcales bacterium]|nr:DivIVA domain-containing protein [Micrococcales bacterium]